MRFHNELQTVPLAVAGRSLDTLVRVRGFDARVAGRGVAFERREPVAVLIREGAPERRLPIAGGPAWPAFAVVVTPVVAWLAGRVISRGEN